MKKRLLAVMVGLVMIVLFVNNVPLSVYVAKIERDRFTTAIQRDAYFIGGEVTPLMSLPGASRTHEITAVLDEYSRRSDGIVAVVDDKGYLAASNDPTK